MADPFKDLDAQLGAVGVPEPMVKMVPEGQKSTRYNNPFNIKYPKSGWVSEFGGELAPDGKFVMFPTPEAGVAAATHLIQRDYADKSIAQGLERFAPISENPNTPQRIAETAKVLGVDPNTRIGDLPLGAFMLSQVKYESPTVINPAIWGEAANNPIKRARAIAYQSQPQADPFAELDAQLGQVMKQPQLAAPQPPQAPPTPGAVSAPVPPQATYEDPTAASLGMFQPGTLMPSMAALKEQAPVAGALITTPFKTNPALIPLAGMGASAGALIAGQGGESMMQGETPDVMAASLGQFNAPGKPFLMGAGAQALTGPVNKILEKTVTAPFAKYTEGVLAENAIARQAQQLAEQGVPISPSFISPSRTSRAVNYALEHLWPANSIMAQKRREVYDAALQMKDEFVAKWGVGKTSKQITDEAWDNIVSAAGGPSSIVPLPNTVAKIKEHIDKPFALNNEFWQSFAKTIAEDPNPTAQTVRDFMTVIKPTKAKAMDKTARKEIETAFAEDLSNYALPDGKTLGDVYSEANQASKFMYKVAPVERLINASKVKGEGFEADLFSPAKFVEKFKTQRGKLVKQFDPSEMKKIDDFAQKMEAMSPDIGKISSYEKMQTVPLLSGKGLESAPGTMAGTLGLAASTGGLYVLPAGAATAMAASIMNPTGLFRKWLTTGFNMPTMPTKVGLQKLGERLTND